MTVPNAVAALVSAQRLQVVPADIVAARARLARADQKLAAAPQIARIDIEAMLNTPSASQFQRIRRRRNKAEYDDIIIGRPDLEADHAHAQAIIDAVRKNLSP